MDALQLHCTAARPLRQGKSTGETRKRCRLCASATAASAPVAKNSPLLFATVEKLFNFPPIYAAAVKQARRKIAQRGADLGVDFEAEMAKLRAAADWDQKLQEVQDPTLQMPNYYCSPFHAYKEGNLCWDAALQANMASQSVHATVMDPERKKLDPRGDEQLRLGFSSKLKALMLEAPVNTDIRHAVDFGCSTGLSTLELLRAFPEAQITALDLSPHFLAVAKHEQQQRQDQNGGRAEPIRFQHAAAESTGLPSSSQDLVSACLLFHELPASAAAQVMAEALRILKPGGLLAIMEMNAKTASFSKVLNNPIAYAAFKSTEPWLLEYISLDLGQLAQTVGFASTAETANSPSHKTFIACKGN